MDAAEDEDNLFAAGDAKLHGGMCNELSAVLEKVLAIFPGVEAARPRSKSGIQALCSLHVALDKARNLLLHCSECSKLYLAITGESILMKFEKTRCDLQESLRSIGCIVPQAISSQVKEIVDDLEGTAFALDESEKKVGDEVIQLLQDRKCESNSNDNNELEVFHQAVSKLGITSSRAALTERRALKKLIEKARIEDDKRKESIVAFLLHLMRKYSKFFSSDAADDSDSGSAPCSPTISSSVDVSASRRNGRNFARDLSKLSSFSFLKNRMRSGDVPLPPEEFRCPISLQLMYDPVIISSGQTFERVCIEKWINDGHSTCPKTQEKLSHLVLTPNYCVKSLITSWCEHNGVPIPEGPPESLDLNYWRLALSETEAIYSSSMGSTDSCKLISGAVAHLEDISAVEELNSNEADMSLGSIDSSTPLEDSSAVEELKGKREDTSLGSIDSCKLNSVEVAPLEESGYGEVKSTEAGTSDNSSFQDSKEVQSDRYDRFLALLNDSKSAEEKQKTIQEIRCLLKDNEEARIYMGENGFVEALVQFLRSAIDEGDQKAQEIGSMALFNLAVNNNSNKGRILSSGVMQLLEKMALNSETWEPATALYLSLSCLDDAKPVIGSSEAVPFLIKLLRDSDPKRISCKGDALYALYNLSTHRPNIPSLLSRGIIGGLRSALQAPTAHASLAVLINMAATTEGRKQIMSAAGFMGALTAVLDAGEPPEQEQAVTCLLLLCNEDEKCSHVVLQEGVIPGLVCVSAYGTPKGKERAQRLLKLFREQRQQESEVLAARLEPQQQAESIVSCGVEEEPEVLPLRKSASLRFAKSLSHIWKSRKSYSVRRSS